MEFLVPSEAVPALIGIKGQKNRDTEARSRTKISFRKFSDVLHLVRIEGSPQNCVLARRIVDHALGHHLASLKTYEVNPQLPDSSHAELDVKSFLFELFSNKC